MMSSVTIGPSAACPSVSPALSIAFGNAQLPTGNHFSNAPAATGNIGALATPIRNRTTISDTSAPVAEAANSAGANPDTAVSTPQAMAASASARRGPPRSPYTPVGL